MARCNDCNKFCGIDSEQEAEINLDVSDEGEVTGDFQIANCCADCGTEVATASFDVTVSATDLKDGAGQSLDVFLAGLSDAEKDEIEIEIENEESERTSRTEGKGRGTKTFYGAIIRFDVVVKREGEDDVTFSGQHEDEIQASSMDEV